MCQKCACLPSGGFPTDRVVVESEASTIGSVGDSELVSPKLFYVICISVLYCGSEIRILTVMCGCLRRTGEIVRGQALI